MPLNRKTGLRRSAWLERSARLSQRVRIQRQRRINKRGKKAKASAKANKVLKAECIRLEIFYCELGYEGCTRDNFLTFAHVAKRRELLPGELESAAILACVNCHDRLDIHMTHAEMRETVERVIAERPIRSDERKYYAA